MNATCPNWDWDSLANYALITGGIQKTPGRAPNRFHRPYLTVRNVQSGALNFDDVAHFEVTSEELSRYRLLNGDLLIVEGNGSPDQIGRCAVFNGEIDDCVHQNHLIRVRVDPERFLPSFLSYYFASAQGRAQLLKRATTTTGLHTLSVSKIAQLQVPLVAMREQQRITTYLSEQLATVEQARAAAEAQLQAARELPATYLRALFGGAETQGWPKVRLGSVLQLRKDVVHPRDNPAGAATFVGLEHVEGGTDRRLGSVPVAMEQLTGRKPRFYAGDVVYGYLRPYLNKVWVADFDGLCSVDQYVYSVVPSLADAAFIAWFMRSPVYLAAAPIDTTPGQLPRIRTEEVAQVEVHLPPLDVQHAITARLTDQMASVQATRRALEDQLALINDLPAALLRQAFSGVR